MALKSCPSCFTQIPAEASACPHCHAELKRCSKCGALATIESKKCSKCASKLDKFDPFAESPDASVDSINQHVLEFKRKRPILSFFTSQLIWSLLCYALMLGGGIMFFRSVRVADLQIWDGGAYFLMLSLVIEFIAYTVKSIPTIVSDIFLPKKLHAYTEKVGYNILHQLANGDSADLGRGSSLLAVRKHNFELAKTSEFAKAHPDVYKKYQAFSVASLAISLFSTLSMIIAIIVLAIITPNMSETGQKIWMSFPMIMEYISFALEVVTVVASRIYMSSYNKSRDAWIKTVG